MGGDCGRSLSTGRNAGFLLQLKKEIPCVLMACCFPTLDNRNSLPKAHFIFFKISLLLLVNLKRIGGDQVKSGICAGFFNGGGCRFYTCLLRRRGQGVVYRLKGACNIDSLCMMVSPGADVSMITGLFRRLIPGGRKCRSVSISRHCSKLLRVNQFQPGAFDPGNLRRFLRGRLPGLNWF